MVVDLFFNVDEFDEMRPRARAYRAARLVAHQLVGEPYLESDFATEEALAQPTRRPARAEASLDDLARRIRDGESFLDRRASMFMLASLHGAESRAPLLAVLCDESEDPHVRGEAARQLGRTGPEALALLEPCFKPGVPRPVREGAVIGLSEIGTREAADRALTLASGPPTPMRLMAVRVLERFDTEEARPSLASAALDPAVAIDIRVSACRGLGASGLREAVEPLSRLASLDTAPRPVRLAALGALEKLPHPDAQVALGAEREDSDPAVAQRARLALARWTAGQAEE